MMATARDDEDEVPRPRGLPAKIIQRASGALLCTGCGGLSPAPRFPSEVDAWRARVDSFVEAHGLCSRRD